ncbi:Thioesterase/thiol ester dehydrase-isomerase [Bimuria novae-zelandiae CBS 107.79]|uniref:Thioesterase/thiol ester dehydrase-isomerase n=1 Tax=Bimuria novae-zelandiae CBS 107.79 TaxID=1447943 RepID=A0A6A5ULB7_9PLEO|nr:Thioesterase/thiol ester dehydrase-isomerase [Bimuria novae-zelandiae CBS 107.79]
MYSTARTAAWRHIGRRCVAPGRADLHCGVRLKAEDVTAVRQFGWSRGIRWQSSVSSGTASQTTTTDALPKKKPLFVRITTAAALSLLTFTLGFTMAALPAAPALKEFITSPSDEETMSLYQPPSDAAASAEAAIFAHPLTRSLLQDPKYIASRPHLKIPAQVRAQNLTGGTLLGDDKIAVPPVQFGTEDGSSFVSLQYLGPALCGHPGIIHGGLLATLLDEGLARCCFPALPNRAAVTASLKVDYKAPAMAGQVFVLRAETTRVEGRKAWVKGRLETLVDESKGEKPLVVTEAEALFIEPRMAKQMNLVKG